MLRFHLCGRIGQRLRKQLLEHGIDFSQAAILWNDERRIEIPARTVGEARVMVIGVIGGQYWSAVVTHRKDKIRIISVRRSRGEEVELYEGQNQ